MKAMKGLLSPAPHGAVSGTLTVHSQTVAGATHVTVGFALGLAHQAPWRAPRRSPEASLFTPLWGCT
eukprot:6816781-Prorocentrum_lima.AAC.1